MLDTAYIQLRNNKPETFENLLSEEIPDVIWNKEADSFKKIGLKRDKNGDYHLIFNVGRSFVERNSADSKGNTIKWKWQGKQPIFNRITGKGIVFFASGVAEWLILDWLGLDYIVLPSDSVKNKIAQFKDKLKDKAIVILPDHDSGSFNGVIETLKSILRDYSYVFNADFYKDKDFRDYCRRICNEPENFKDNKEAFIESLFYNIWTCAGGSEVKDDSVTEDDLVSRIKEIAPLPESTIYYDPEAKEYVIYDVRLNYIKKEKAIEYIKNIYYKDESLIEGTKKARTLLHKCPVYKTILDPKLLFGVNDKKFNIFKPTDILAYKVNDNDRQDIDIENFKGNFPYHYKLFNNLFNTKERMVYFLNWISYIMNTLNKTRNCIVLTGVQGTGKGLLFEYFIKKIFGNDYCVKPPTQYLKSNFSEFFHNKLFLVVEETNKKNSYDILDKLKTYITDPTIIIEKKFMDPFTAENRFNMFIFSNSVSPIKIEASDRRYSIFKSDTPIKSVIDTKELVEGLKSESDNFLKFLKSLKYDEKKAVDLFETDEKIIAKEDSYSKTESICDKLKQAEFDELLESYPEYACLIEKIKEDINNFDGFARSSLIREFFRYVLSANEFKRLKLSVHFGKAKQKRINAIDDSGVRTYCYKITDKYDLENSDKTKIQWQVGQMQYV